MKASGPTKAAIGLASLMIGAGTFHLVAPGPYESIIPGPLRSWDTELVYASGAAEIGLGLGLLPARTRRIAGWGIAALLVAVFPANVQMAIDAQRTGPEWLAWGTLVRLPIQIPLILWALYVARQARLSSRANA